MKNNKFIILFVVTSIWFATNGYGQSFHSASSSPLTAGISPGPWNVEQGHQLNLHLDTDKNAAGRRLRKTGTALFVTGLATTVLSFWAFTESFKQVPWVKPNPETPAYRRAVFFTQLSAVGVLAGASTTLAGSVVWIIGNSKTSKVTTPDYY